MPLYETRLNAFNNNDIDTYLNTLHDDFVFVSHQDGTTMNRSDATEFYSMAMTKDAFAMHDSRCLYENDDVMIEHLIMSYPDNTREAVLVFNELKDGKVIRTETGATLLS